MFKSICFSTGLSLMALGLGCSPLDDSKSELKQEVLSVYGYVDGKVRSLTSKDLKGLEFVSHNKILTWEGIIENFSRPGEKVHIIDTAKFEGHLGYTQEALGRGKSYDQRAFFDEIQPPATRRYMPFMVYDFRNQPVKWEGKNYRWVMNIRRYNFKDTHLELAEVLAHLRSLLQGSLFRDQGEPLLYVYDNIPFTFRRPHINFVDEIKTKGFSFITENQMIDLAGGDLVSILNPGKAFGYLKLVKANEPTSDLTPKHIAIFEDTPERIPPVAGIITLEPQTPLSHVNLLARNRGTPNVSTASIDLIPSIAKLLNQLVAFEASKDGQISLREASISEAELFWKSRQKEKLVVPEIRSNSLEYVDFSSDQEGQLAVTQIGSKASNYATIQKILGSKFVLPGFALTFSHYLALAENPVLKDLIGRLIRDKDGLSPTEVSARLEEIRNFILTGTDHEVIGKTVAVVRSLSGKMPGVKKIRLRSSTNSEDLPTFNGAGLYESEGFKFEDNDEKLKMKILNVMASLWLDRAYWERELFGIDHLKVGMAILINPAFVNESANGVVMGSESVNGFKTLVNAQKGEASVTNPLEGEVSELFSFLNQDFSKLEDTKSSNLGSVFLSSESKILDDMSDSLLDLQVVTKTLHDYFVGRQRTLGDKRAYGIDLEFKILLVNGMPQFIVKQSRLLNLGSTQLGDKPKVIRKAVAKNNGMSGAHLRRFPKQIASLTPSDFCFMPVNSTVGISAAVEVGNGFSEIVVAAPSSACPGFKGKIYVFSKHFNFLP